MTPDQIELAQKYNLSDEVVSYVTKNKNLRCKCGDLRRITSQSQSKVGYSLTLTCGKKECHNVFGKKRPEHSKHMRDLAASGKNEKFSATLMKKGEKFNPNVNSLEFKAKVLENKGVVFEDAEKAFSLFLSERNKSCSTRAKQILTRFEKWEPEYKGLIVVAFGFEPTKEWVYSLTEEETNYFWSITHGINSIRNYDRSLDMGRTSFFKTETLSGLKFNKDGITSIRTRSGWERSMIRILESKNVHWSYEKIKILCEDGRSFYIPDFIVYNGDSIYMVEIKGGWFNQDRESYMKNKIAAAIKYCKERGWSFVLTSKEPTNLNFLEKEKLC